MPPLRRLLGLGRYAPAKGWDTVLRALAELPEATLALHGPQLTPADRAYRPALERLAAELGLLQRVSFGSEVAYDAVPGLFAEADALVNATRGNAADKVLPAVLANQQSALSALQNMQQAWQQLPAAQRSSKRFAG